jgi:hypothetical protein
MLRAAEVALLRKLLKVQIGRKHRKKDDGKKFVHSCLGSINEVKKIWHCGCTGSKYCEINGLLFRRAEP